MKKLLTVDEMLKRMPLVQWQVNEEKFYAYNEKTGCWYDVTRHFETWVKAVNSGYRIVGSVGGSEELGTKGIEHLIGKPTFHLVPPKNSDLTFIVHGVD